MGGVCHRAGVYKGADCDSPGGSAFGGSNPPPSTRHEPDRIIRGGLERCRFHRPDLRSRIGWFNQPWRRYPSNIRQDPPESRTGQLVVCLTKYAGEFDRAFANLEGLSQASKCGRVNLNEVQPSGFESLRPSTTCLL